MSAPAPPASRSESAPAPHRPEEVGNLDEIDRELRLRNRSGEEVRALLRAGREVALLDVRPEPVHAEGHPLFAASFPRQRLEVLALDLLPRRDVPIVLLAGSDVEAADARRALVRLGFTDVAVLDGGIDGWVRGGGELFRDVNAPSKAFGELVEARAGTPSIGATELAARRAAGERFVLVDARTLEEHRTMNVPGSLAAPGGELVARVGAFAPDPATTIVVHCAGRTRSIIGAQSLIDAAVPNPVVALRNGTIGWTLAGLELETGSEACVDLTAEPDARLRARAAAVARRAGARDVTHAELAALVAAGERTVYRYDVRTPDEHARGHPAGFASAPGGQLVQETDAFAPVRGAVIVLFDDVGVRAHMTASWLAQMGWEVLVVRDVPVEDWLPGPHRPDRAGLPHVELIAPHELAAAGEGVVVLDVSVSTAYARAHVPGAAWVARVDVPGLLAGDERLEGVGDVVLVSEDDGVARFAAADLATRDVPVGVRERASGARVRVLAGGTTAWRAAGLPVVGAARHACWWSEPADVYRRPYVGTDVPPAAMRAYLDWEFGLVEQLARDGTHRFRVLRSRS